MSSNSPRAATPLFIDTGAFYARFVGTAQRHDQATALFEAMGAGKVPYRPLYTSTYVLDELATLVLSHRNHGAAVAAIERVLDSPTSILYPTEADFEAAYEQFRRYDDHEISFTDHMSGVLASDHDIEHVFTHDPDHFRTLDCIAVPADTGDFFEA